MKDWQLIVSDILLVKTQDELAEQLGVTQGYISHLLVGRRKNPSYSLGIKLTELHQQTQKQQTQKQQTPSGN